MLYISVRTAESHRAHIVQKLRLGTRAELVRLPLAHALLEEAACKIRRTPHARPRPRMERAPPIAIVRRMSERKRVLIAGGGVAAVEAALTLQGLARELVEVELVAPEPRFWYRPLAVAEPFGLGEAQSFDLADLAQRAGALFTLGSITRVDAADTSPERAPATTCRTTRCCSRAACCRARP